MQSHSVMSAVVQGSAIRFCVFPEPRSTFPSSHPLLKDFSCDKITVHKDAQGMLRAQKKNLKLIFDPPTGNFKVTLANQELEGTIQTGLYASPLFLVRLGMDDSIYGLGAATSKPN